MSEDGTLTVLKAGAILEDLDIHGCVVVKSSRVTVRRSRITCGAYHGILFPADQSGQLVEDVEINGLGELDVGLIGPHVTYRRVNVHDTVDGVRLDEGVQLLQSYVHHLRQPEGAHSDVMQTLGGSDVLVQGNRLEGYNPSTGRNASSVLQTGALSKPVERFLFIDNYVDGGGWSIGTGDTSGQKVSADFRDNVFGRHCAYGAATQIAGSTTTWAASNRWFDTGEMIAPGKAGGCRP